MADKANDNGKGEAPSLAELKALLDDLGDTPIDTAIAATEKRLKMLRAIRGTIGVQSDPKPRTKRETTTA